MCNTRGRGAHPYSSDWLNPWLCIPDVSSFVIKSLNRRNYAEFSCCTHCHFISFTSQYEFGHLFVFITASIIVDIDSTRCQTQSFWDLGIYWEDGISSCCRFFFLLHIHDENPPHLRRGQENFPHTTANLHQRPKPLIQFRMQLKLWSCTAEAHLLQGSTWCVEHHHLYFVPRW